MEETKIKPDIIKFSYIDKSTSVGGSRPFYYYEGIVDEEVTPELNNENTDFIWCAADDLPSPMFPKTIDKINNFS